MFQKELYNFEKLYATGPFTSGKGPRCPLSRRLGGPQSYEGDKHFLSLLGMELRQYSP
jgi:hypothetical protein